jgi:UDP-glucose 4-epimerase
MRYLVTGGAGFIGSHLVEQLVAAGGDVVVLDDLSSGRLEHLTRVRNEIRFIAGSVTDPDMCRRAVEGVDAVFHLAALTSVQRSVEDPLITHEVNATGTINILHAACGAGVRRVVLAASTSAYGNPPELPNRETHVAHPLSPYAASKLAAEEYCRAFHAAYGLETVALRYFNVFGPRQDPASQYAAAVPRFIVAALSGIAPSIYGDGRQTRDFVYVANVVQANLLAATAPAARVAGEVFNVGCGRSVSVTELWDQICALVGVQLDAEYVAGRPGEVRASLASIDKARELIGYEPEIDFEEGLRRTIAYFRETMKDTRRTPRRTAPRRVALLGAGGS